jgi:GT2 family glycosyltransferase
VNESTSIDSISRTKVTVLMACHNRGYLLPNFFESFFAADSDAFDFNFIVMDDGSVDDTYEVLLSQQVSLKVLNGTGHLYWAKSMALAEASIDYLPDAILWINDDVVLFPNAFSVLMRGMLDHPNSVLIGQVKDMNSSKILYGGYSSAGANPLRLKLLQVDGTYVSALTFNGNFVYIPTEIRLAVGKIDGNYGHAYADCDYGLRVSQSGYSIWVLPETIGECKANVNNPPESRFKKFRYLNQKKQNPIGSQFRFFIKHTKRNRIYLIPLFLITPYLKILLFNSLRIDFKTKRIFKRIS